MRNVKISLERGEYLINNVPNYISLIFGHLLFVQVSDLMMKRQKMPRLTYVCEVCRVNVGVNNKSTHDSGEKHLQKKLKIGNNYLILEQKCYVISVILKELLFQNLKRVLFRRQIVSWWCRKCIKLIDTDIQQYHFLGPDTIL